MRYPHSPYLNPHPLVLRTACLSLWLILFSRMVSLLTLSFLLVGMVYQNSWTRFSSESAGKLTEGSTLPDNQMIQLLVCQNLSATRSPSTPLRGYRGVGTSLPQGIPNARPPVDWNLSSTTPYVVHQLPRVIVYLLSTLMQVFLPVQVRMLHDVQYRLVSRSRVVSRLRVGWRQCRFGR